MLRPPLHQAGELSQSTCSLKYPPKAGGRDMSSAAQAFISSSPSMRRNPSSGASPMTARPSYNRNHAFAAAISSPSPSPYGARAMHKNDDAVHNSNSPHLLRHLQAERDRIQSREQHGHRHIGGHNGGSNTSRGQSSSRPGSRSGTPDRHRPGDPPSTPSHDGKERLGRDAFDPAFAGLKSTGLLNEAHTVFTLADWDTNGTLDMDELKELRQCLKGIHPDLYPHPLTPEIADEVCTTAALPPSRGALTLPCPATHALIASNLA